MATKTPLTKAAAAKKRLSQKQMASLGGLARAKKFTREQRAASARHAAKARWGKKRKKS